MNQNSAYRSSFASLGVWFDESEFDEKRVIKGKERKGAFYNIDSSSARKREDEVNQEVLDLKRCYFESGKIQPQNVLSTTCEDYLLDIGFAESITNLDYVPSKGLLDPILESQIPLSSCDGISYSSGLVAQEAQSQNAMFGLTNSELHDLSHDKYEGQMLVDYNTVKFPTTFTPEDISNVDDVAGFFAEDSLIDHLAVTSKGISFTSTKNEVQNVDRESFDIHKPLPVCPPATSRATNIATPVTQKRLRKPTKRYIDETSELNTRRSRKKEEVSTHASKNKLVKVRCPKKPRVESMEMELFLEESSCRAIQVPFASLANEERPKRHTSNAIQVVKPNKEVTVVKPNKEVTVVNPKVDAFAPKKLDQVDAVAPKKLDQVDAVSPKKLDQVDAVAPKKLYQDGTRRKHHRLWTVSECKKLIDGVAQYGVGRWSHIKKLFFSSSVHRTPVDLKDKWRNLLKASYLQKQTKLTVKGNKHNLSWRPLPKSVLHRVTELANMHPYPRNRRCNSSSPSPVHTDRSNIQ